MALAAFGTVLVMKYRPMAAPSAPAKTAAVHQSAAPAVVASGSTVAPGYADVTTRSYFVS